MKKIFYLLLLTILLAVSCETESSYINNAIEKSLILEKASSIKGSFLVISTTNELPENLATEIALSKGTVTGIIPEIGIVVVSSEDPLFVEKASKIKGVQSVVPNLTVQWIDPNQKVEIVEQDFGNPPASDDDDLFFDFQWGHDAVNAPEAWSAGYRGKGVRVFVLDSGVDAEHSDIAPNLNTALCKSFVPGEHWNIRPGFYFNHGTHVAGTIAAADNGFGIIGVAPEAELVAVKVLSEYSGSGSFSGIIEGIIYAANNDADIINMSIGAALEKSGVAGKYSAREVAELKNATSRAITYAYQRGTTIITSAGNEATDYDHTADLIHFPSDAAHAICISATAPIGWIANPPSKSLDYFASYSNYGQSEIDFAAPGGDSVYKGKENCTLKGLTRPCWVFDLVFSDISGGYGWAAGTSMASPHAAGVAAIIIGKNGGSMKPAQVEAALRASADDLGKPGNDDFYGAGRVNAYKAVTQ